MAGAQLKAKGDIGLLAKRLKLAMTPEFRRGIYKQLSVEGLHQVALSFRGEKDPYDKPWKPLQHPSARRRDGRILSDKARLRNSFHASSSATNFAIDTNVVYAAIHNYGGSVSRKARVQPVHADTGAFIKRTKNSTSKRSAQVQGKRATAIRFLGAATSKIPARPWFPSRGNLGPRWTKAFTDISNRYVRKALKNGGQ